MLVAVNGTAVTVMINGMTAFEYVFPAQIVDGQPVPLNKGLIGLGSQGAKGTFDNVAVQVLKPQMTLDETETFDDGIAQRFTLPGSTTGVWTVAGGRLGTTAPAVPGEHRPDGPRQADQRQQLPRADRAPKHDRRRRHRLRPLRRDRVQVRRARRPRPAAADRSHARRAARWVVDFATPRTLVAGQDYDLQLILRGAAVSVTLNGAFVVSWGFNAALVDGLFGVIARGGSASYDAVQVRTNDEAFAGTTPPPPARRRCRSATRR